MERKSKLLLPMRKSTRLNSTETPKQRPSVYLSTIFNKDFSSKLHLFLFLLYSGTSLNTLIPTSYFSISSAQRHALFYFREGELHMESDSHSYEKFFELTKELEMRKYRQPKYIHFTTSSVQLYADEAEAREHNTSQEFSLLQKFINSGTKFSRKLRIRWNREKGFTYFLVSNKNPLPKSQWFTDQLMARPKNSSYMFNVSEYNYAGRLLKTSFSPFHLHKSKMKTLASDKKKLLIGHLKAHLNNFTRQASLTKVAFAASTYITKQSDSQNSVTVTPHVKYAALEGIIKDFLSMIERWRDIMNGAPVNEAYFDFIENSKGKWLLIGCKIKGVDLELLLQSVALRRFIRTSTSNPFEVKKVENHHSEEEVITKKLDNIRTRIDGIKVKPAEYVSFDRENEFSIYKSFSASLSLAHSYQPSVVRDNIVSPLAELYDKTVFRAKELKKQAKINEELCREYKARQGLIETIISEIIGSVLSHDQFSAGIKPLTKTSSFKEFIDTCLKGGILDSRSMTHQMIREIGVNSRNFQEFLMCFNQVLEKYYDDDCKDLIIFRVIDNAGFNDIS
jgi:hypothetical protein